MPHRASLLLASALFFLARACSASEASVLFLGNSFTSANDLPGLLSAVAASYGDKVSTEAYAPGGYSFEDHAKDPKALARIRSREWSFIVLQEQSERPTFMPRQLETYVTPYALKLDGLVRDAHATTVFYETWGYKDGDPSNCPSLPETCSYDGMQRLLSATYADFARRTAAVLAPVGSAWRAVRLSHPEIGLYDGDGKHPSVRGSYLAACVFYSALFRRGAQGLDPLGLAPAEAAILQRAAQEAVFHPPVPAP